MSKEAIKLALEAFKKIRACTINVWDVDEEIKALEESLAKQEQGEPVAHCEAGPNYCWKCLEEAKPTYGSEEIRKLREVIASQAKIIEDHIPDAKKMVKTGEI